MKKNEIIIRTPYRTYQNRFYSIYQSKKKKLPQPNDTNNNSKSFINIQLCRFEFISISKQRNIVSMRIKTMLRNA